MMRLRTRLLLEPQDANKLSFVFEKNLPSRTLPFLRSVLETPDQPVVRVTTNADALAPNATLSVFNTTAYNDTACDSTEPDVSSYLPTMLGLSTGVILTWMLLLFLCYKYCGLCSLRARTLIEIEQSRRQRQSEGQEGNADASVFFEIGVKVRRELRRDMLQRCLPTQSYVGKEDKGTTDNDIVHFKIMENDHDEESVAADSCAICLVSFQVGDAISQSTTGFCVHEFHRDCIAVWLSRIVVTSSRDPLNTRSHQPQSGCPVCRQVFLKEDAAESDHTAKSIAKRNDIVEPEVLVSEQSTHNELFLSRVLNDPSTLPSVDAGDDNELPDMVAQSSIDAMPMIEPSLNAELVTIEPLQNVESQLDDESIN